MNKILLSIIFLLALSCKSKILLEQDLVVSSNLRTYNSLASLKEVLKDVEILALGEDTHGLGEVFKTKTDLVKFLHQELGFGIIAIESGFADVELANQQIKEMSGKDLMFSSTSYSYYHCEEMLPLYEHIKYSSNTSFPLELYGFDCQPQQDYFKQLLVSISKPLDSTFAKLIIDNLNGFNLLYQYEQDNASLHFQNQLNQFINSLDSMTSWFGRHSDLIVSSNLNTKTGNLSIIKALETFKHCYAELTIGELFQWPNSANFRDSRMYQIVQKIRTDNPGKKIILWGQNKHIESRSNDSNVKWLGNYLKESYGDKYYSVGSVVYKGNALVHWNNHINDFEHNTDAFLAYHLNLAGKNKFLLHLREKNSAEFLNTELLMMSVGGNTSPTVAQKNFDGILFIHHSDSPTIIYPD